jgi:hypothetical protein
MPYLTNTEREDFLVQKFIDFDKHDKEFYNNFYLKEPNLVVKMLLMEKNAIRDNIKIGKFSLDKRIYLLSYE